MTLSKQQVSFGIFSSISFRKPAKHLLLGLIYHKLHFLTTNFGSELLWWGFLGIQTKSTISQHKPWGHFVLYCCVDFTGLFYLKYLIFCVKIILWALTGLTIDIKSPSILYYVLLFNFDLWQNPEFLFVCLVAESTTDSATRLDIGILPNHTETNTNK